MTRPQKYLTRITLFLIPVTALCIFLYPKLYQAFVTNPGLNGLIAAVLFFGIILSIRQVTMLTPAIAWIESFQRRESSEIPGNAPNLLAPMAAMMGEDDQELSLSMMSTRTILDGIAARMDEGREMTRYFIGLLIFLGLLGTFWGLLGTIGSIKDTINNLTVGSNDITVLFEDLKEGLSAPLGGMGTAFSSSLFGLAGSVILGFIDLQAGQAQGRFFNDLEDWLSSVTKLSRGSNKIDLDTSDTTVPAYVSALLEQSADSLENLHNVIASSEENRNDVNRAILSLAEQLATLSDSQSDMRNVLKQMLELFSKQLSSNEDNIQIKHLRNIDIQFKFLTDETIKGQNKLNDTLKSEFKLLARTMGALVDNKQKKSKQPESEPNNTIGEQITPNRDIDSGSSLDYEMPIAKPKSDKKVLFAKPTNLTARKDD